MACFLVVHTTIAQIPASIVLFDIHKQEFILAHYKFLIQVEGKIRVGLD